MSYTVELDEGERQLVLMALAWLSLQRPGWDVALNAIALKLDEAYAVREHDQYPEGTLRGTLYDSFRQLRLDGLMQARGAE